MSPDSFIEDKCIWEVILDNGAMVYQDDDRPGVWHRTAWIRLYDYVTQRGLYITSMRLRFRTHIVHLPTQTTYIYRRGIIQEFRGPETQCHVVGNIVGDQIVSVWYRVPELIVCRTTNRDVRQKRLDWAIPGRAG